MANSTPSRRSRARRPAAAPAAGPEKPANPMTTTRFSTWQAIGMVLGALVIVAMAFGAGLAFGFAGGRASGAGSLWSPRANSAMPFRPYAHQMPYGPDQMPWHDSMPFGDEMPFDQMHPPLSGTAYLGIVYEPVDGGASVNQVIEGSPAQRAGLRVGDVIQAVDGERLSQADQLRSLIQAHQPGDRVTLTVVRGSEDQQIVVILGTAPETAPQP